jgi:hypothetical protein
MNHNSNVDYLKSLLQPYTHELAHKHNMTLANLEFPSAHIPHEVDDEKWKFLTYYKFNPNRYLISSWGRIYDAKQRRYLTVHKCDRGYSRVDIEVANKQKYVQRTLAERIHRLVALTFFPNDINETVNHIDLNKQNNTTLNLEWLSFKDNMKHAAVSKAMKSHKKRLSPDEVKNIRERAKQGEKHRDLAKEFNVKVRCIGDVVGYITHKNIS